MSDDVTKPAEDDEVVDVSGGVPVSEFEAWVVRFSFFQKGLFHFPMYIEASLPAISAST